MSLCDDPHSVSVILCFQPAQPCPLHISSSASAGELMNLCDNPHSVSVGQEWAAVRPRGRVPIFITANDLSLLYAVSLCPCTWSLQLSRVYGNGTAQGCSVMCQPVFVTANDLSMLYAVNALRCRHVWVAAARSVSASDLIRCLPTAAYQDSSS